MKFAIILALLATAGCNELANQEMDRIEDKVATDAENQYDIAAQSGTAIDRCVQAGMVSAAWLQAEDQAKYAEAKSREQRDCAAAGVPR